MIILYHKKNYDHNYIMITVIIIIFIFLRRSSNILFVLLSFLYCKESTPVE